MVAPVRPKMVSTVKRKRNPSMVITSSRTHFQTKEKVLEKRMKDDPLYFVVTYSVLLKSLQGYFAEMSHPWRFPWLKFMFPAQPYTALEGRTV